MERLTEVLARQAWAEAQPALAARPPSPRPTLVLLAGVPLSGKSTFARALAAAATTRTLHVENDALRERLVRAQGKLLPTHADQENYLTYRLSWELCRHALEGGANAVHDGTSLTENGRRGAYKVADAVGAPVVVLIVTTDAATMAARVAAVPPDRQAAHAKLGHRAPDPRASRPFLALDGGRPVEENLERLRALPELAALWAQGA